MSSSPVSFSLIGPGRAGRSLLDALDGTHWEVRSVFARGDTITTAAEGVDVVIVAVPDDAIASVAADVEPRPNTVLLHLSGAKTLEPLAPHRKRASVHPLVALPNPQVGAARLRDNAAFAVAGDPIAHQLVDALDGRSFEVDEDLRSLYHATAAIASNHLIALSAQVARLARQLDLPFELYGDLMTASLANAIEQGPIAALTGPAARGDRATIAAHHEALSAFGQHEVDLYNVWANEAERLGRIRRGE